LSGNKEVREKGSLEVWRIGSWEEWKWGIGQIQSWETPGHPKKKSKFIGK
jgi:hypothetical protein